MDALSIILMNWRDIRNPDSGGAEVYVHELARRWAAKGHRVTLLTSQYERAEDDEVLDGVRVVRQGSPLSVYRRVKEVYMRRFRSEADVVIDTINTRPFLACRYVKPSTLLVALVFQLAREFWNYETPFPISYLGRYWLEDRWLKQYRTIPTIALSQSTRDDLHSLGFKDIAIVRPGCSVQPLSALPVKESTPTAIFVGRLKRAKLPDHALRAFKIISRKLPESRFWIVGDGYLRRALEHDAPGSVTFFGRVSDRQKVELMTQAHVLLYPAVREGWGLTISEANAVGTPAVGYDVPGLRDSIQNGRTGVLVPFGDVSRLATEALSLLTDSRRRDEMAVASLDWARTLTWERAAEEFLQEITKRLSQKQPSGEEPMTVKS